MSKSRYFLLIFFIFILIGELYTNDLIIRRIIFEGNSEISERELRSNIISRENTPVNRGIVNDDARRIYNFYQQSGFHLFKVLSPSIVPISYRYVDLIFHIEEFSEPLIEKIIFTGNSYFSEAKIYELTHRNENEKHDLVSLDIFIRQITELYLSRGFLFVSIQLGEIESGESLTAHIDIVEGAIVRAENFVIRGNNVSKENIIIAESRIHQGAIITPSVINHAERRIAGKPYITSAHIVPVNANTLLIDIHEGKMTHLSAIMGYSTSAERKNVFNGFVNAEFLNLLGTDRNFHFAWRSLENDFSSVRLGYHESGPITIPIAADLALYREERDSTSVKTEIGFDIYYQLRAQKYGILYGLNELYPGSRRPKLLDRQTDRIIGFFWEGDFTDDFVNPREGWKMKYTQQYFFVSRETDDIQRHKFEASMSNFYPLGSSWVLANTLNGKYLENKELTEFDLLRVGGAFSLRGFYEDFFAGNTIIYTNTEFRFLLSRYSRIFLFLDYGYVEDNRAEVQSKFSDLFGMGFGIRAESRLGLIRIDYGFHHQNGKWLNPLNGIIHFGVEASF